jgi:hypothetical protein
LFVRASREAAGVLRLHSPRRVRTGDIASQREDVSS